MFHTVLRVEVALSVEAAGDYGELPRRIQPRIDSIIRRLENWPQVSGAKPLAGKLTGSFRVRTGDYRIMFRIVGQKVIVWKIGHRKDVYSD